MKEPVSPGVPPEREVSTILKPTLVAELDDQIKTKEGELVAVNNKRRDRVGGGREAGPVAKGMPDVPADAVRIVGRVADRGCCRWAGEPTM